MPENRVFLICHFHFYIEENQSYAGLIRLLNEPTVIVIIEHIMASI